MDLLLIRHGEPAEDGGLTEAGRREARLPAERLAAGLSYLQGQYLTDYPSIMAGALLSIIPLIIIYAIFQKQFIEGIALTGIKG